MKCRHCNNELKYKFADLGKAPPSNAYLENKGDIINEEEYPLITYVCDKCWLVQTEDFVSSETLFNSKYAYVSSASNTWVNHCRDYTSMIIDKLKLSEKSLVVEIASNDGCLLENFHKKNIQCYGVEPTDEVANMSIAKGIETHKKFFNSALASELAHIKKADLICGNNVYAHVPDINDFTLGLSILLNEHGSITLEFPHLLQLIQYNQFDTIYHEHFSYLSLNTVNAIFNKYDLEIYDVDKLSTHGGSLRVYGAHKNAKKNISETVGKILEEENNFGIKDIKTYTSFQDKVDLVANDLKYYIKNAKNKKFVIAGYGAAAKGNTLLNFAGITANDIDFVIDASPLKINMLLPGSHIPIYDISKLKKNKPDVIIILPWNLSSEIKAILDNINDWGAEYVSFIPSTKIYK
jgi:2-polyprenyl-3-methyl-5-hydroxy-6-metoxy-1,4-benzoquinol methylase